MKLITIDTTGKKGTITASDSVFGATVNQPLLSQAVRVYLSNQRQGSAKTKTRAEINRTKKKWFKQKGTGNARHGARTPNIFVGGGVSHGPTGHENWSLKLTTELKRQALISALSAQAERVVVSDVVAELKGKTKAAAAWLSQVAQPGDRVLVILPEFNPLVIRALRNIPNVLFTRVSRLTAFEAAVADVIVTSTEALQALEDRLALTTKEAKTKNATQQKQVEPLAVPTQLATKKQPGANKTRQAAKATPTKKAAEPKKKAPASQATKTKTKVTKATKK